MSTSSGHYQLTQDLLSREAGKGQVPPGGGTVSVTVDVKFAVLDILDIDDVKQVKFQLRECSTKADEEEQRGFCVCVFWFLVFGSAGG